MLNSTNSPKGWGAKSKDAWNKSFGKDTSTETKISNGMALAGAAGNIAGTAFNLSTINKGAERGVQALIDNNNSLRINTDSLEDIANIADTHRYLKDNYKWSDFYRNGGYLHRYDAGGRMATGILSNTANGAGTGAAVGGPWGALIGGVVGLGSGVWGALAGHSHANKVANNFNKLSMDANSNWDSMLSSSIDNAKYRNLLGMMNTTGNYANGGILDYLNGNSGATDYVFMTDYLNTKRQQAQAKNNMLGYIGNISTNPVTYGCGGLINNPFAFGGDLQTHGSDYSTGLTHIDTGSSHEANPNGGVPMGIASDGQPNLVEQGETVNNKLDYVYSERLKLDKDAVKALRLPKRFKGKSFADVSKYYEKESSERPNDPISQAALQRKLQELAEVQEAFKEAQKAKQMRKVFESLPPEQQQQVLAMMAQQQGQQQEAQEMPQGGQEVPMEEQPVQEGPMPQEGTGYACGGHLFDHGGSWKKTLSDVYGYNTVSAWNKAMHEAGYEDFDFNNYEDTEEGYKQLLKALQGDVPKFTALKTALAEKNPIFNHALEHGYTFDWNTDAEPGYDWEPTYNKVGSYNSSKNKSTNNSKLYQPSNDNLSIYGLGDNFTTTKELEKDPRYVAFTNDVDKVIKANPKWRVDDKGNITLEGQLNKEYIPYIKYLSSLTNGVPEGTNINQLIVDNGEGIYSFNENASNWWNKGRNDGNNGIMHITPIKVDATPITDNYLVNGDNIETMTGTPTGQPVKTYTWRDKDGKQHTYNYYEQPKEASKEAEAEKIPYLEDRGRIIGAFAPLMSLGAKTAGLLQPDFTGLNEAEAIAKSPTDRAGVHYIHNYKTYTPWELWNTRNMTEASNLGIDRSITNSSMPVGGKVAAKIANGHAGQLTMSDVEQKARSYDDSLLNSALAQNTDVDKYNAQAFNQASDANAKLSSQGAQYRASLMADIADKKMTAQAQRDKGIISDAANFIKGIGDYYRENAARNMLAAWLNSGGAGTLSPDMIHHGMGQGAWNSPSKGSSQGRKYGGKINRKKKGLTY